VQTTGRTTGHTTGHTAGHMTGEMTGHTTRNHPRRRLAIAAALSVVAAVPAVAGAAGASAAGSGPTGRAGDDLAVVRQATAKYHDVAVALADGYVPVSPCTVGPTGVMGFHYLNPTLAAAPIDLRTPAELLYVPGDDGLELAGVEYFKADADQDLSTDDDRPTLLGQTFDGPMPGHGPGMPIHFDLHVWIWQYNPDGMFAGFNPRLGC
jgi:hypothetical protein